jgi:hypothetical protein
MAEDHLMMMDALLFEQVPLYHSAAIVEISCIKISKRSSLKVGPRHHYHWFETPSQTSFKVFCKKRLGGVEKPRAFAAVP